MELRTCWDWSWFLYSEWSVCKLFLFLSTDFFKLITGSLSWLCSGLGGWALSVDADIAVGFYFYSIAVSLSFHRLTIASIFFQLLLPNIIRYFSICINQYKWAAKRKYLMRKALKWAKYQIQLKKIIGANSMKARVHFIVSQI